MDHNTIENLSLKVFLKDQLVFSSDGKWLYPLFDFEDYLRKNDFNVNELFVNDKVIGKAAGLLMARLGIRKLHGELMSNLAIDLCKKLEINYGFTNKIPRIQCKTEELLLGGDDPEFAYQILCKRANRC